MNPRIGVLTSGGDCPGLNAVLRGVVLAAERLGWEVVGFRDGFEGLLPPGNHVILDRSSIDGIMALGGTIIGTTNRGHFVAKVGAGNRTIVPANVIAGAKKILDRLQVKALIIVGGDGSMVTAQQLQEVGINCIGVPKTIDNDLEATATTSDSIHIGRQFTYEKRPENGLNLGQVITYLVITSPLRSAVVNVQVNAMGETLRKKLR
jgi:6-phosphofructokinase